jgi:hypothetical protein
MFHVCKPCNPAFLCVYYAAALSIMLHTSSSFTAESDLLQVYTLSQSEFSTEGNLVFL